MEQEALKFSGNYKLACFLLSGNHVVIVYIIRSREL